MSKAKMRDIIIILPGITGSVLQKDGRDIWGVSPQAAWSFLSTWGSSLQQLQLDADDCDPEDGIRASGLIQQIIIPGFYKSAGYSDLSRLITDNFEVTKGRIDGNEVANFFEFPYDWRLDNRCSAKKLQMFIERRLYQWRQNKYTRAKVILLAHSMGGLVARYYLEVLEGWKDCRALFTFGTPYRGSVDALNFLCNGYKQLFLDLAEVLRSLPSAYQLLPIYEMLNVNGNYRRVAEVGNLAQLSQEKAQKALAFHREIEVAAQKHWTDSEYRNEYKTIPIVGTRQPTRQSAMLSSTGEVIVQLQVPPCVDSVLDGGDGTVPRVSATPIELSQEFRETFIAERHSSLQSHDSILSDLNERIRQMQAENFAYVRGANPSTEKPALSLDLDDLYLKEEPVKIHAELVATENGWHPGKVSASIYQIGGSMTKQYQFTESDEGWHLLIEDLPAGLYRIEVQTYKRRFNYPQPLHDLFHVL